MAIWRLTFGCGDERVEYRDVFADDIFKACLLGYRNFMDLTKEEYAEFDIIGVKQL